MKLSCGVVPYRGKGKGREYLVLRCFRNWDFPKGMKEVDEDPLVATRREFSEETGIKKILISAEELFIETEPYGNGKVARYYLGEVNETEKVQLLPNPLTGILEHHEFRWVSADEARDKLVPRLKRVLDWAEENLAGK